MGKTYKKQSHRFDDDATSGRSGKHAKHSNNHKGGGMKTLNSYVEQDYDFEDYDPFDDEIEISDDITIQHTKNTNDTP
jgi:hypothetical protein